MFYFNQMIIIPHLHEISSIVKYSNVYTALRHSFTLLCTVHVIIHLLFLLLSFIPFYSISHQFLLVAVRNEFQFTPVRHLTPLSYRWTIRVRLTRLWDAINVTTLKSYEIGMTLLDQKVLLLYLLLTSTEINSIDLNVYTTGCLSSYI